MQEAVDVTADLLEAVCFTPVVHVHLVGSPSVRIFLEPEDGQQQQESAIAATDLAASHLNTFAVLPVSGHTFIKTMPTQNRVRVKVCFDQVCNVHDQGRACTCTSMAWWLAYSSNIVMYTCIPSYTMP